MPAAAAPTPARITRAFRFIFHLPQAAFLLFLRSWNIDRDSVNVDKAAAKPARDRQECNRNNRQDDAKSLIVG